MLSIFRESNITWKEKLHWLILFLYTIGIVSGINKISYTALGLFFLWCLAFKKWPSFKEIFAEKSVRLTCKYLAIFIGLYGLCNVLTGSYHGVKETGHYIERILPFFVFMAMSYKHRFVLEPVFFGMIIGAIILTSNMAYEQLLYKNDIMGGYLGNHNKAGGWSILIFPAFIAVCEAMKAQDHIKKVGMLGAIVITCCWIIAGSRGAWVAGIAELFAYMLLCNSGVIRRKMLGFLAVMIACIAVFWYMAPTQVTAKGANIDGARYDMWLAAWRIFLDYPLLGIGYGNWNPYLVNIYRPVSYGWFESAAPHNLLLTHLVDVGMVGTSGIAIMLMAQCRYLINRMNNDTCVRYFAIAFLLGIVGMLVHGLVDMIPSNRFYMKLYSFLWALLLYVEFQNSEKDGLVKNNEI